MKSAITWTQEQKKVVLASFLGWMLDAFDFFVLIFILKDIAAEFHASVTAVATLITMTLAFRPVGALIFGYLADRIGRRTVLIFTIAAYSVFEFLSGFATSLAMLFILRTLFGIAMGAEWGVGSALAMESIPVKARGLVSGILQTGYPVGYLVASVFYGLFHPVIGWRGLLMIGILPALLVFYIRRHVKESPEWEAAKHKPKQSFIRLARKRWKLVIYAVLLMAVFNFLSHGTQDLYPLFLQVEHGFSTHVVSAIAIVYNIGAILGGLFFGVISERLGRRYTAAIAALGVLVMLPMWVLAKTALLLAVGAFLMQFMVQGAWGVVPAHLNELSPGEARATFPGFVYQLGNLLASCNATLQAMIADYYHDDYRYGLAMVTGIAAIALFALLLGGPERRGHKMTV